MSTTTKIEWTRGDDGSPGKTWNPLIGCERVSPGCHRCYAMGVARIREFNPNPKIQQAFAGTTLNEGNGVDWTGKVNLLGDRLTEPLSWKKPAKVFVNSMSDLFHKDVPLDFIVRTFAIMALTPQHTYQILTKRHARMRSVLKDLCKCGNGHVPGVEFRSAMAWACSKANPDRIPGLPDDAEHRVYFDTPWPLPNVHVGVSVENQKWADIRIPALVDTPAAVRFISAEPLLGPVTLFDRDHSGHERDWDGGDWTCLDCSTDEKTVPWRAMDRSRLGIDWVIVGGESGPGARAMHPDWARSLRDQCVAADVPYLFKQWGEWGPADWVVRVCDPNVGWLGTQEELAAAKAQSEAVGATHAFTGNWHEEDGERKYELYKPSHKPWSLERGGLPDGSAGMRRWGKKAAGRELDGRTWDQYPTDGAA